MVPAVAIQVLSMLVKSRTMQGTGVAAGTAWYELLPKATAGDATSIGLLVLSGVAYARAAQGRWKAERNYKQPKGK